MKLFLKSLFLVLCFSSHGFCLDTDTITSNLTIRDPDFVVSSGQVFKLGFFTPQNTTNRYLAIYYNVSENSTVWLANRDSPLTDTSGTVTISEDGNLVLVNGRNETIWSTNATSASVNTTAQILDTGNLVLRDVSTGNVIWDCFSHPSNIFMPSMRLYENTSLSSWKSPSDPGVGNFTSTIESLYIPQVMTWRNGRTHYRSGPWNGNLFIGIKEMYLAPADGFRVENDSRDVYFTSPPLRFLTKTELDLSGSLTQTLWDDRNNRWQVTWASIQNECDLYGMCGPFGICNPLNSSICSCLGGFEPANRDEWRSGNWTSGCTRRTQLRCHGDNGNGDDVFLRMPFIKVPNFAQPFPARREDECRNICLRNCSCLAYSHDENIGCMFWSETLIDIQQFNGVGPDIYIRLASSEFDNSNDRRLVIIIPVVVGVAFLSICIFIAWCWMAKKKGRRMKDQNVLETLQSDSTAIVLKDESEKVNIEELPLFTFKTLADATNQFHEDNMLGKGGFGHVYKGTLANGKQVAVKRLSATSGQGGAEFRNEAVVISKVQHRNLVKLLGCCVEREEKMLVYEYMPNKSLDVCLFDPTHPSHKILDWIKRFSIIEGIGRGLLYLHVDSRLKIIHRDLKPSNVLLDGNWNPKISDFGMARIFGGNQDQANTAKVVGTYGYMAPEYAIDGRFSEKSDVYSFGVLMLEIAWKLWNEGNGIAFADQTIANPSLEAEIVRCIHIALLCVQEFPKDRPAVQTVVSMLNNEIVDLPLPEQPVFAEKWDRSSTQPTSQNGFSTNELTITVLDGR
ncbi:g-type lectin s-receptor-like serine/threonine-protein kinase at1g11330 [Phtheirospermum japonicum]|uniref:Receptor-like serine/threonine-protein kinase n=1 Tax=Phtheirospermum japonicum TaxID=374723 RepID=A0A830D8I2_9LAMI|nr:g-type lectin s-receptor-like serine/threonine-protein kinase at1g11330 [Phtheirospermum japonicum]